MIYYSSKEAYVPSITDEERQKISSISYKDLFNVAIFGVEELKKFDLDIIDTTDNYIKTCTRLKKAYARSWEAEKIEEVKTSFGTNIKNFFIKIWSLIKSTFLKLVEIVKTLLKAMLIFIKKMIMQKLGVVAKFSNDKYVSALLENDKAWSRFLNEESGVRTIEIDGKVGAFPDIHLMLNNKNLEKFIRGPVYVNNKNSVMNIDAMKTRLQKIVEWVDDAKDAKIDNSDILAESNYQMTELLDNAVIYGEVTTESEKGYTIPKTTTFYEHLRAGHMDKIANELVFGSPNSRKVDMSLAQFFNSQTGKLHEDPVPASSWEKPGVIHHDGRPGDMRSRREICRNINAYFRDFKEDSKRIIEKGGLMDTLYNTIKRYLQTTSGDANIVKSMEATVKSMMGKIEKSDPKIISRFKSFTNLMNKVRLVKARFISFRVNLAGNMIIAYQAANSAFYKVMKAVDGDDYKKIEGEGSETSEIETISTRIDE